MLAGLLVSKRKAGLLLQAEADEGIMRRGLGKNMQRALLMDDPAMGLGSDAAGVSSSIVHPMHSCVT